MVGRCRHFRSSKVPGGRTLSIKEVSGTQEVPRFDRFKAMLRGLRVSGVCVLYQDSGLDVLMVENIPDIWPARGEIMERGDAAIFDEAVMQRVSAAKKSVLENGGSTRIEVPVLRGKSPRWFELTIEADTSHDDPASGIFVTAVEITDLIHREQVLKSLLREVSHRSKNLLAIIQSIAMQTARFSNDLDEFLLKFRGRIQSLSESQDLVTDSNWQGARFSELVDRQLSRYIAAHEGRVTRSTDDCRLTPNAALHIGLAFHELAVNSAIHGALADGHGSLGIDVEHRPENDGAESLVVSWTEHLAEKTDPDVIKRYFGSALLEKVVPMAVDGTAVYQITEDTVRYVLTVPSTQYD